MTATTKVMVVVLLTGCPLYGQPMASNSVTPIYDQPASRMATEPVPLNTNPYLVPANRNPYFDDPPARVEGVPTGNPEIPAGIASPSTGPGNLSTSGGSGFTGGIGNSGTDGMRGSGD